MFKTDVTDIRHPPIYIFMNLQDVTSLETFLKILKCTTFLIVLELTLWNFCKLYMCIYKLTTK